MISDFEYRHSLIINLLLVENEIRPALLVQPVDYGESVGSDKITKSILIKIKKWFPRLIHSEKYSGIYQGIIISKKSYNDNTIHSNEMGKILGYPCYKDFDLIDREEEHFSLCIYVYLKDGQAINVLVNVCQDISLKPEFELLAEKIVTFLVSHNLYRKIISNVGVVVESIALLTRIIDNVKNNMKFDKDAVLDVIYNLGFSNELQFVCSRVFAFDNEHHRGILLALLLMDKNFILDSFVPLLNYPGADLEFLHVLSVWEHDIISILQSTLKEENNIIDGNTMDDVKKSNMFRNEFTYNEKNKVHQGILLLLLSYVKNKVFEPFLRLKNQYPDKVNDVNMRLQKWGDDIVEFIGETKRVTLKKRKKSVKRKTNKRRKTNRKPGKARN
jgi:hypothetical protein